ncbi:MAG: very short patch repair endonuclease [Deltaproteobacteria bacterium]|nr:very short patch repair endonuclease [Deltaproteobacteria bacterium]
MAPPTTPRFDGLKPRDQQAARLARATSAKRDTRPERTLRRALFARGLRYRVDDTSLPGRPDVAFRGARVVVFCDGDFWHGRDLAVRLRRLGRGHNAAYWTAKLRANVARDDRRNVALLSLGFCVVRVWESDVVAAPKAVAHFIERIVKRRPAVPIVWRFPAARAAARGGR